MQLDTRIVSREAPMDRLLSIIAPLLPGSYLFNEYRAVGDSRLETLSMKNAQFDVSDSFYVW